MSDPTSDGNRAILAGFFAFIAIGMVLMAAFALFRVVVPLILEAHFFGSVLVASLTGLFGTLGLGVLVVFLSRRIAGMIRP